MLVCSAEHKSTKPNCFQPLQYVLENITQDVPHHLKSFWDWLSWHCVALLQLYAQPFCTPCSIWAWFATGPVLWPTHFLAHQYLYSISLQFLKADSNCRQPKRYLSLTSKHNGVLFFQHGLHWGKENGISRQYVLSTPKNCPAALGDEHIHHKKMFPAWSQTYSFYSLSSNTFHCNSFCNIPCNLHT